MKKGQTYVQKSWDPVGYTYSDGEHQLQQQPRTSVSLFYPPERRRQTYGLQLNTGSSLTNQIRGSLYRRSVSGCSDPREGSCGSYFLYTLATFALGLEEGFAIPVSLPHTFTPHNLLMALPWDQSL